MLTVATVFMKEIVDTLRDRRTLLFMIVIPLLLFPVLFKVLFLVQQSNTRKAETRILNVAVVDNGQASRLREIIGDHDGLRIAADAIADSVSAHVRSGKYDGAFVVDGAFDERIENSGPGRIDYYFRSTGEERRTRARIVAVVEEYEEEIMTARLARLGLGEDTLDGIDIVRHNVATQKEMIGARFGAFIPYVFILFCFLGAMYPAIDLGAGEKERGTLETLLTTPVDRYGILFGKFGVVVLTGISSALVSMVGLYLGVRQSSQLQPEMFDTIVRFLGAETVLLVLSLLLPLTIFFAGLLLSVSLMARSFKEAQSLMTPLNIAVILPVAIALMPGMSLDWKTALIPVLNVSLATKQILGGTMDHGPLALVYVSLVVFALLGIWSARAMFNRESIIFRD